MPLYNPPASSGGGYSTFEEEGAAQTQRTTANFVGAGVTVSDSGGKTQVSIPGGSGDYALNLLAPVVDETITAGYSATVERQLTIASGKKLTIGSAARLRIH